MLNNVKHLIDIIFIFSFRITETCLEFTKENCTQEREDSVQKFFQLKEINRIHPENFELSTIMKCRWDKNI